MFAEKTWVLKKDAFGFGGVEKEGESEVFHAELWRSDEDFVFKTEADWVDFFVGAEAERLFDRAWVRLCFIVCLLEEKCISFIYVVINSK